MSLHPLLKQQFEDARQEGGQLDLRKLLQAISAAYAEWDDERRGVVRSMKLLADETSAFTREVRESAAAQLQAILDHVKDAILTVDDSGRIETLNTHRRARVRLRRGRRSRPQARPADPLARAPPEPDRGARGTRRIARGHAGRPGAARDARPPHGRHAVRRRTRREQGPARPPRGLHRLPARHVATASSPRPRSARARPATARWSRTRRRRSSCSTSTSAASSSATTTPCASSR